MFFYGTDCRVASLLAMTKDLTQVPEYDLYNFFVYFLYSKKRIHGIICLIYTKKG